MRRFTLQLYERWEPPDGDDTDTIGKYGRQLLYVNLRRRVANGQRVLTSNGQHLDENLWANLQTDMLDVNLAEVSTSVFEARACGCAACLESNGEDIHVYACTPRTLVSLGLLNPSTGEMKRDWAVRRAVTMDDYRLAAMEVFDDALHTASVRRMSDAALLERITVDTTTVLRAHLPGGQVSGKTSIDGPDDKGMITVNYRAQLYRIGTEAAEPLQVGRMIHLDDAGLQNWSPL